MSITTKILDDHSVQVNFSGTINEKTEFPKFTEQKINSVFLHLKDAQSINSLGILHWIRWYKELEKNNPGIAFQVFEIRIQLLSCASVVSGFLPANTKIMSFYLPYHNEIESLDVQELYVKGDHYNDEHLTLRTTLQKNINGQEHEFELDCMPDRDLRVLNLKRAS